jgi:predicted DsbA family dithiol-disulfide isomerase
MPFELRPHPMPTLKPEGWYLQNAWKHSVYPLAAQLGIEIRLPEVSPQPYTRLAFEGLEFARDYGAAGAYHDGVMRAFFQQSRDIGRPDVLADIAASTGMPRTEFSEALESRRYADRVGELLRHAYEEEQVTAVPLFVIGDVRLTGLQSRERLESAMAQAPGAK